MSGHLKKENEEPNLGVFDIYINLFFELDTCRNGMSGGPIPFTDIHKFATIKEIEDFDEFLYIIRRLDITIIKLREKENGNTNSNNKNKS